MDYTIPKNALPPEEQEPASEKRLKFVEGIQMGMVPLQAAKYAGVEDSNRTRFIKQAMENAWVQAKIKEVQDDFQAKAEWTRERVMGVIEEGIDMARVQASPGDLFKGVQEINKMCGYYAPEKKEILTNSAAKRVQTEFESMSQEELLELVGKQRDAIEVEFEVLDGE